MLDSCLHFQQTHRNSQFSYGAAFCNLANGSRIFTRFFFFAFHLLPRQTSGSVAAEVHQLVALTASAGCLVARGGFIGRFSLRCCRKRCWWGWIWTVKLRVVKLKQKCWKILKRSVKLRGEIWGFVSTTPKKQKTKIGSLLNSTQHDALRVPSDDTVEGTDPSLVRLFTLVRLCA